MWPARYQDRLASWTQIRNLPADLDQHQVLSSINSWWFQAPWTAHSLHWADRDIWPDPWQLLEEKNFCSLARGLGILYTIALLKIPCVETAVLQETTDDNLVLVEQEKYILNWDGKDIVNINPSSIKKAKHQITLVEIQSKIK